MATDINQEVIRKDDLRAEESGSDIPPTKKSVSRFTRWYRSPLFNVIVVGLISFTQPGIWNALNNTGAGGQQEPYLVNGANSLTFGCVYSRIRIYLA